MGMNEIRKEIVMAEDLARGLWRPHLRKLVAFEKDHGKTLTILKYRPLSEAAIDLNYDIPSTVGSVDVDWMMCLAGFSRFKGVSWIVYITAKRFWNSIDPRKNSKWESLLGFFAPWARDLIQGEKYRRIRDSQIFAPPHLNAHRAAHLWMSTNTSLSEIFHPALAA